MWFSAHICAMWYTAVSVSPTRNWWGVGPYHMVRRYLIVQLITGNITPNQTAALLSRLRDGHSVLLPRYQWLAPQSSQTRIELKSHRLLFRSYWGSSVWCIDGCVGMTGYQYKLCIYPPPVQALVVSTQADREATVYGVAPGWWELDQISQWGDTCWANHW